MNPPTNEHVDIAGYLMEMLTPPQKQRADHHLAGCTECRTEVQSMREWADALRAIPEQPLVHARSDDGDLLIRQPVRRVGRQTATDRLRRMVTLLTATAAVLVVAVGGVIIGRQTAPAPISEPAGSAVPGTRIAVTTNPVTAARMQVTLVPVAGWVRVRATVGGIPAGQRCRLEVVGRDETAVLAASWLVADAAAVRATTVDGSALIDPAQVTSIRVLDATGKLYVSVQI